MRVLHLLASPVFSGPAENVVLLARAQRALGCMVSIAADRKRPGLGSEEPLAPRLEEDGLMDAGDLELSVKSTPWRVLQDIRALRRRNVDVVHAHFSHDHFVARWGRPRGACLVRSIHAARSIRRSLPAADAYTVATVSDRDRLKGKHAVLLPTLVDPRFAPAADRGLVRRRLGFDGPTIGMVSTFQDSRRHQLGLEAFALLRRERADARLVLVGDGILEPALRAKVAELGLTAAVQFTGYRRSAAFVELLQGFDEVWVLGLGNDASGRTAAQARACGARVVAVAEGALPELADEIVAPEAAVLAAAALRPRAVLRPPPTNEETAGKVLELYRALRGVS